MCPIDQLYNSVYKLHSKIFSASAANPIGRQRHYVFSLSVSACVHVMQAQRRHSPTLPSNSRLNGM